MTRVFGLNLVSGSEDRELDAIRRVVATFENASGLDEVIAIFRRLADRGDRSEVLDAIGHSRSHGFLSIGAWVLDDSPQTAATFSQLLGPPLRSLGVRAIRLLGCSTATTDRGRNAIRRIAHATGCHVFGTKRYVSHRDYGPDGFMSDHALVDAVDL